MAPKNKLAEADLDLAANAPAELVPEGGEAEERGVAVREPMNLLAGPGEIALPMEGIRPPPDYDKLDF